jgi:hypothetical protein
MRLNLSVISYEEMFAASEEGLGDRVRDCGSDTVCVSSRLRAFNARLGLVVVIDFSSKPVLISLQLLDTDDARLVASSVGELSPKEAISASIRARARELLEKAGHVRAGRLLVEVDPPNARVAIAGFEPDPGTPNRFTVAPGTYTVTAALDGWSAAKTEASVEGGAESKVRLELVREGSLLESPWLWIAIGVVAAGSVTAGVIAAQDTTRCVCATIGGNFCGCAE